MVYIINHNFFIESYTCENSQNNCLSCNNDITNRELNGTSCPC